MVHQVFISYANVNLDRRIAEAIRNVLETRGIGCWIAPRNIGGGKLWEAEIVQAIRESPVLLLVFSSRSNASPQVQREVTLSVHYRCRLLTYRIEDVEPDDSLEYCLCKTHWKNAFQPLDDALLGTLADDVQQLLNGREEPPGPQTSLLRRLLKRVLSLFHIRERKRLDRERTTDASEAPLSPLSQKDRAQILGRLADEMLEQRSVIVRVDHLPDVDRRMIRALEDEGTLLDSPSAFESESHFTTPAKLEACQQILADRVLNDPSISADKLLEQIDQLGHLADATGKFLASRSNATEHPLLLDLLPMEHASVGRIVVALMEGLIKRDNDLKTLSQTVVARGGVEAVSGLARGANRLLESGKLSQAELIYEAVQRWSDLVEDTPHRRRFVVELANQWGRLLRRMNRLEEAERQFRETLRNARDLGEATLIGIVANGLAGVLLDLAIFTEDRWHEAVELLNENLKRFSDEPFAQHLAVTCNLLGAAHSESDPFLAESYFRRDVSICRQECDDLATVDAIDRLAAFLTNQGQCAESQELHREELQLCGQYWEPRRKARALANLGSSYLQTACEGDEPRMLDLAHDALAQSCEIFSTLDEPRLHGPTLENLGHALLKMKRRSEGIDRLKKCVEQYRRLPHTHRFADEVQAEIKQLEERREEP